MTYSATTQTLGRWLFSATPFPALARLVALVAVLMLCVDQASAHEPPTGIEFDAKSGDVAISWSLGAHTSCHAKTEIKFYDAAQTPAVFHFFGTDNSILYAGPRNHPDIPQIEASQIPCAGELHFNARSFDKDVRGGLDVIMTFVATDPKLVEEVALYLAIDYSWDPDFPLSCAEAETDSLLSNIEIVIDDVTAVRSFRDHDCPTEIRTEPRYGFVYLSNELAVTKRLDTDGSGDLSIGDELLDGWEISVR